MLQIEKSKSLEIYHAQEFGPINAMIKKQFDSLVLVGIVCLLLIGDVFSITEEKPAIMIRRSNIWDLISSLEYCTTTTKSIQIIILMSSNIFKICHHKLLNLTDHSQKTISADDVAMISLLFDSYSSSKEWCRLEGIHIWKNSLF